MKTTFFLNGHRITKKAAAELLGKERLQQYTREAWERFQIEPGEEQSWFVGAGILTIEFGI